MTNKPEILRALIERAVGAGWDTRLLWDIELRTENIDVLVHRYLDAHIENMIIFDIGFAIAVGYKLEDLGRWMDEGKDSLDFLNRFC